MSVVVFGERFITTEDIVNISLHGYTVQVNPDPEFKAKIEAGAQFVSSLLNETGSIYGVTTGYGDSCDVNINPDLTLELPAHLYTFHGCGMGEMLTKEQARAVLAVRLASLSMGVSGVRYCLLQQLALLLNHDIIPVIPSEGSVGASGDLTPLSYVAACLCGEREVYFQGQIVESHKALEAKGITPLVLQPKEALAIMNGTAVMTALAVLAFKRSDYMAKLCCRITSMAALALGANKDHFAPFLFSVKPHSGQIQAANYIRQDIGEKTGHDFFSGRLQERYSIRCAPHVIGVLLDALPFFKQTIENEINSANDNPIIDWQNKKIYHGGHFYGGHIAFVMDSLKNLIANCADLLDRQIALLVDSKYNHGLPRNLSGAQGERASINHGFKALQIACSAWTAEALKLTMPASVFSRSTESHNQDKVSMGTIAARDCLRVLTLTEQVAAVLLMASKQALYLRERQAELSVGDLNTDMQAMLNSIDDIFPMLSEDQRLDRTVSALCNVISTQLWTLYNA